MDRLITNAQLITWESPIQRGVGQAIFIKDGLVAAIGSQAELEKQYPAAERLDARGQFVMPGNICAHTHFYGAYSRGMAIAGSAPKDFLEILQKLWWPLDQSLNMEAVRLSTQVMIIDAIKHGTTSLFDHHASPNAIEGSLDVIADAVEQAGLRAVLCYEVTDRGGEEKKQAGIEENVRFLKSLKDKPRRNIRGTFGMHASLTLSEQTLNECRAAVPDGVGFHTHVAEAQVDQDDSLAKYNMRVVERLHHHDMLGENSIFAHAVHVDAHEINLLAESGSWVTHQPRSNMNNAVGMAQIEQMMRAGVRICLGTDGFSSTMWDEWKTAYLGHKLWHHDPHRMPADVIAQIAVHNNAELLGRFFKNTPIGFIREGAAADLIFVDYHPYTPITEENLPWHIVFGFHESMVTSTMVDGLMLMHDRQLLTIDEEEIVSQALALAPQVWAQYQKQFI
jgi:putative selenium metabolism protein SsnA